MKDWSQDLPRIAKSVAAKGPYVKWHRICTEAVPGL